MNDEYSAWNPGLESDIPPAYRPLETLYHSENVRSRVADFNEVSRQTGLSPQALVIFQPERLALHELIIRVTSGIVVLEGEDETELGRNFRAITKTILAGYIQPNMAEVIRAYDELRDAALARIQQELRDTLFAASKPQIVNKRFSLFGFGKTHRSTPIQRDSTQEREHKAIGTFKEQGLEAGEILEKTIYRSLYRVLGSIAGARGYLGPDLEFLSELVCNHVCNSYGSRLIGKLIAPWVEQAIETEGYTRIPCAAAPILISLKGASAAGKSSLRPMLLQMMAERGMQSEGYATVSPDIWRRLLLDYDSLGEAYKYAGRLTSHEVMVIDSKLDHHMRSEADRHGSIPHLLVDRFRFDSFSSERISRILHGTYVEYVDTMYMYFVITPPHATVQRGWERGLKTGRYKAVEDFLDHSVEAYTGMPKILFKWIAYDRPLFKYEFLDNSVPKGTYPRSIAFGDQKEINIVDCSIFIDIERYRKINIRATSPMEVYPEDSVLTVAKNIGFLMQCVKKIPRVNFIDEATDTTYVTVQNGIFQIVDATILKEKFQNREQAEIFAALAPDLCEVC